MNNVRFSSSIRRKAVWGPKRWLAALFLISIGLAPSTAAAKPHNSHPKSKHTGVRPGWAKDYKLDDELSNRAARGVKLELVKVIAELNVDGKLPRELQQYA